LKRLFPLAIGAALFLSGCERNRQLSGEVFIVTGAHESVKLGLVEIGVFDAEKVSAAIRETKERNAAEVEKMSVVLPKLQDLRDAAEKQWHTAVYGSYKQGEISRLSDLRIAASALCEEASSHAAWLQSSSMFFEKLPHAAIASVKTDADGRFTITVPNRTIVLGAKASRRIPFGGAELYYWLVRVDPHTDRIMLSNDNLMSSTDARSVVWATERIGQLGGPADALAEKGEKLRKEMIAASDPAASTPRPIVTTRFPIYLPTPTSAPVPAVVTVKQPTKVLIAYGEVTLQPGTKLQVLARNGGMFTAQFGNDKIQVPVSATDSK
jgi:hypothetical protein